MKILFICTGNTCRSPMAMSVARTFPGIEAFSRGVMASVGQPMSAKAVKALREAGIQVPNHKARQATKIDVERADLILTMTQEHLDLLVADFPQAKKKTFRIDPAADVDDPFGLEVDGYLQTLRAIQIALLPWVTSPTTGKVHHGC